MSFEHSFRIEFDINTRSKRQRGLSFYDIRDTPTTKKDFKLVIVTPDGEEHTKYISRDVLSRLDNLILKFPKYKDDIEWSLVK